eukprot:scaffold8067_cov24-Tisochrysis_lutea.AAC.3
MEGHHTKGRQRNHSIEVVRKGLSRCMTACFAKDHEKGGHHETNKAHSGRRNLSLTQVKFSECG